MPKFSIVIPVYNVEKYIGKCLDSVINQTYQDYEVIVIDDGSTDKSKKIVKEYDVKLIESNHVGVSEARNIAIKKAKGEYLVFLDSDDWWDKDLLKKLATSSKNSPDLIRFQMRTVTDTNEKTDYVEESFTNKSGEEAFSLVTKFHFVDAACCYAIKRAYYEKEKFSFAKDRVHEDYGLMPLIIIKAASVNCISYVGYNYFRRTNSIMNTPNYEWTKRKVNDFYYHYLFLSNEIEKVNVNTKIFKSFIANSMLLKICELNRKDYKAYKKKLNEINIYDNLISDTLPRKVKKVLLRISPRIYYKIMK